MPSRAFLDTTIVVDALLKNNNQRDNARQALGRYSEVLLPVYAIKEFKAGALRNYVWFHNKVVVSPTFADAVAAIGALRMQPNKQSTALGALAAFKSSVANTLPADWGKKYPGQTLSNVEKREATIWLRTVIMRAWRDRRKLATSVVEPLTCYTEKDPEIRDNGTIDDTPVVCSREDCCMRDPLTKRSTDIDKLIAAADLMPDKSETMRRRKVLRQLRKHPARPLSNNDCRSLGDAIFALQCPSDAVVLTTNVVDHAPLAAALNRSVESP